MAKEPTNDPSPALPSLVGLSPEQFATLIATFGATQAGALQAAIRSNRKENPNYPERSVYNPAGKYDDFGKALEPKVKLRRDTYYCGVLIGKADADAELNTPDEITLFNRFTDDKTCRDGRWKVKVKDKGTTTESVWVDLGSVQSIDDRNGLPPLTHILRELLDGADAVNPETLLKQVAELKQQMADLLKAKGAAA